MNLHEHMRQDHTSFIPDKSPARARLDADVDAFLGAGGKIEYVETGRSGYTHNGLTSTFKQETSNAGRRGRQAMNRKGRRKGEAWR